MPFRILKPFAFGILLTSFLMTIPTATACVIEVRPLKVQRSFRGVINR